MTITNSKKRKYSILKYLHKVFRRKQLKYLIKNKYLLLSHQKYLLKLKTFYQFKQIRHFQPKTTKQLVPLTKKSLEKSIFSFYFNLYKLKTIKTYKLKIYYRDYNKKPYWKLRESRLTLWNYFKRSTLNKRKYVNFNTTFLKKQYISVFFFNIYLKTLSALYIPQISLDRIKPHIISYFLILNPLKKKLIFKLPLFFSNYINWDLLVKKELKFNKKIGKYFYKKYLQKIKPWLQKSKSKTINYLFKKSIYKNQSKTYSYFDISTNTGLLFFTDMLTHIPYNRNIINNYLVKLNTYRYQP